VHALEGRGDSLFLARTFALCAFELDAARGETYFAFGGRNARWAAAFAFLVMAIIAITIMYVLIAPLYF
jgi:hypothetical protein